MPPFTIHLSQAVLATIQDQILDAVDAKEDAETALNRLRRREQPTETAEEALCTTERQLRELKRKQRAATAVLQKLAVSGPFPELLLLHEASTGTLLPQREIGDYEMIEEIAAGRHTIRKMRYATSYS